MLLGFAKKNPGMTRVLIGDALVNENERLQVRINQLHDRLEATLKQCLRFAIAREGDSGSTSTRRRTPTCCCAYVIGRWHQYREERLQARSDGVLDRAVEAAVAGVANKTKTKSNA